MRDGKGGRARQRGWQSWLRRRVPLLPLAASLLVITAGCASVADNTPTARTQSVAPMFGAFTYGGVHQGMQPVEDLEAVLGRRLDVVHWFMSFDTPYDVSQVEAASADGRLPLITWEPASEPLAGIAAGTYDSILAAFADGVKATPGLVYVRPMPEMNGEWVPWNGKPALFVQAWRHMVTVFRQHGADNVRWVWSPNATDQPATTANAMESYWPGAGYVDVLGLDGYNWGTSQSWSRWESFEQIFARSYARVTSLGPEPVWITEVASSSQGGDKAAWVRAMLTGTEFPRIRALVWFNQNKETDWRLDNSLAVIQSIRASLGPSTVATASR